MSPLNDFKFIWLPLYIVEGKKKKKRMGDDIFGGREREKKEEEITGVFASAARAQIVGSKFSNSEQKLKGIY